MEKVKSINDDNSIWSKEQASKEDLDFKERMLELIKKRKESINAK